MLNLIECRNSEELSGFDIDPCMQALSPQVFVKNSPDAHWMLVDGNLVVGRLSLWYTKAPVYKDYKVGVIGHYAARDLSISNRLLEHACAQLSARGCTLAVGPMDGNTMHRYRFVVESSDEPRFLLEPENPEEWPDYWRGQGFTPISNYYSSFNMDLSQEDPRIPEVARRLHEAEVSIRNMNPEAFEDDLRRIYQISAISFRNNFMYVPFTQDDYLDSYMPLREYVDPRTVFIAEREEQPVGFMFNIPNHLQKQQGGTVDTLILKTYAEVPGRVYAGLGSLLVAHSHRAALELGYRRGIHALMYERNNSFNTSNRFSKPFRRYALFSKALQP